MAWIKKSGELDFGLKIATFESLAGQLRAVSPEDFLRYHPMPFLQISRNFSLQDLDGTEPQPWEIATLTTKLDVNAKDSPVEFSNQLIELAKTDRNDFSSKISIGRTSNNDMVLKSRKISKLHSEIIIPGTPAAFRLADMGSLNGTYVNGTRLDKHQPVALQNGDLIGFYRFVFRYLDVNGVIQYIQRNL